MDTDAATQRPEWTVLRALCSGCLRGRERARVLRRLRAYAFPNAVHQAVFDAVNEIESEEAELLRQQLPGRLTRRGFPDVDFDSLLSPPAVDADSIQQMAAQLLPVYSDPSGEPAHSSRSGPVRRVLDWLGLLAVATAASYLAYLAAGFALFEAPRLLLALLTDVELDGIEGRPRRALYPAGLPLRAVTSLPENASLSLQMTYQWSFILGAALLIIVGMVGARRLRGWGRPLCAHLVLWSALPLPLLAGVLRPPRGISRLLGVRLADSGLPRVLLIVLASLCLGAALYLATRRLLDSVATTRRERLLALLHWLVLPATLASLLLYPRFLLYWNALLLGLVLVPALMLLLVGLPAALTPARPAPELRRSVAGAMVVLAGCALVITGGTGYERLAGTVRRGQMTELESERWELRADQGALAKFDGARLAGTADERLENMAARLGVSLPNQAPRAYLYASADAKAGAAGDDQPFTLQARGHTVHHLLRVDGGITDSRGDALLLLHSHWGPAGSTAVAEAIARYAVGHFYGHGLADYARGIAREERAYRLREVLGLSDDYLSPLVRDALGGAWVESLVIERGTAILPVLYRTSLQSGEEESFARALATNWGDLEHRWETCLREQAAPQTDNGRALPSEPFFHRGISFSHEVGGRWGYGSDRSLHELERIRALGANAVAVVPYAFTRAPNELQLYTETDESDDRVLRTLQAARHLGLRTMLKPQVWARQFTGDITFESPADFERWFTQYHSWMLHYARLAELEQVDVLAVGTELGGMSHYQHAWRNLIRDVRRVYAGRVTYAAHWGPEFEQLPFWDALDYLGLNMYYPLAEPGEVPRADSPRVKSLVDKLAAFSRRYGKPILFTEVGYPSVATAAVEPWKETRAALDLELQARCYAVVFDAFAGQPWLAGLYWWKWPSHGRGSAYDESFSPLGKPAVEEVARRYGGQPTR